MPFMFATFPVIWGVALPHGFMFSWTWGSDGVAPPVSVPIIIGALGGVVGLTEGAVESPSSSGSMAKNGFLGESEVTELSSSDIVTARHRSV